MKNDLTNFRANKCYILDKISDKNQVFSITPNALTECDL